MKTQYNIPVLRRPEPDPIAERVRATWTAGDFGRIAIGYERGASEFVTRLGLEPDEQVLDVACGTGNLTIPAARTGAAVTGIDIAENLIAQARVRAAGERLTIVGDVGDAEAMPYDDNQFDTTITMFGAMFAARPERVASELLRVTKPGGRIAMANWTPTGFVGEMLKTTTRYLAAPTGIPSPLLWGMEDQVQERLGADCRRLTFNRRWMTFEYPVGPDDVVELFRCWYGPTVRAFGALDAASQIGLQRDLTTLWARNNRATDGTTIVQSEYLEVIATVG